MHSNNAVKPYFHRNLSPPQERSFFLFGPRMTGKSTWLREHFKLPHPGVLYIDLLHEKTYLNYLATPSLLEKEVQAAFFSPSQFTPQSATNPPYWVVIDEIQRVPELLNTVHRLIESQKNLYFALTGSSARKLKRGGANLLAGRATELKLFPLTWIEIQSHLGHSPDLESLLMWGTLPAVLQSEPSIKKQILQSYTSVYLKDEIQSEGMIRNLPSFSRFLQLASECISQELNYSSISKEIGVASKTISSYFSILEETFLGFTLPPWSHSVRKELAGSPKFYLFDNGVTNALRESLTDLPVGNALGQLFEQFVIQQVKAILNYRQFEGSLYFWRARGGREVDLIIARGKKPILAIEIKNTSNPQPKDFSGLKSFADEYPKTPGILVSQQLRAHQEGDFQGIPITLFLKALWSGEVI